MRLSRGDSHPTESDLKFERSLAENMIYHLSILSLFEGAHLSHSASNVMDKMTNILTAKAFADSPQWANSPLLGGCHSLFRLMYEITELRSAAYSERRAVSLARRLFNEDQTIQHGLRAAYNQEIKSACFHELRLFSTAAKILLCKKIHPERQRDDPFIQQLVREGVDQLRSWPSIGRLDQYFCWPLLVIGCAVKHDGDIELIRTKLDAAWCTSRVGDVQRVMAILEYAWALPAEDPKEPSPTELGPARTPMYSLDILLHKDGVFRLLDPQPQTG